MIRTENIYVGKKKNLKRVSSYFNKIHDTAKTNVLVKKIVTIKHIVVPTETDALLLENNLIKTLQPRYNVLLRDDKVILGFAKRNFLPYLQPAEWLRWI
jgi:excinuclease ABC subunit C